MLKHPGIRRLLAAIVACALLQSVGLQAAWAQEVGVVGTGTPESCTETALDSALADSNAVTFNCGPNPATVILSVQKTIGANTTIDGGGAVILSAHGSRHFVVNAGASLTVSNITLRDGFANGDGGSIFNSGTVVISNTLLTNNQAVNGSGGAIVSYGTLTILQSTFEDNAGANGGAVYPRWDGAVSYTHLTLPTSDLV